MSATVTRAGLLAVVGALVVGGPVLAATPAEAHNYVVASTPSAGQTLTQLPEQFEVVTNEPLLTLGGSTAAFAFQIVDAAGMHYETGCVTVEGAAMSTPARLGAAGEYTALWQLVSEDGHSVSGEIPFTWAPGEDSEITQGSASAPACGDDTGGTDPSTSPTAVAAPDSTKPADIPISDVLWIGGALVAVGAAVGIAILLLGRRKPTA